MLAGHAFQDRLVELQLGEARHDRVDQLGVALLVDVGVGALRRVAMQELGQHAAARVTGADRQQLPNDRLLAQYVDEVAVDDVDAVDLVPEKRVDRRAGDRRYVSLARTARQADELGQQVVAAAQQQIAALAADRDSLGPERVAAHEARRRAHHVGVVGAGQTPVAGYQHQRRRAGGRRLGEQRVPVAAHHRRQVDQDLPRLGGVRARRHRLFLRALHPRGRHHFHGVGHLRDVAHAADTAPDLADRCHAAQAPPAAGGPAGRKRPPNSSRAARSADSMSSVRSRREPIAARISGWAPAMKSCSSRA